MSGKVLDLKLRFPDIVFLVVLVVSLLLGSKMLSIDSDLGRHLTMGNYILDERVIPARDLFSHTRTGFSRPPYEWLSQIIFALAHRPLALDSVFLLTSFIVALTMMLTYLFASKRSRLAIIALVFTFIAVGASSIHWLPRPHIFTLLILIIWIELLNNLMQGKSVRLFLFPLIMLLWANLHGGFIFGILAWAAYFAGWLWESRLGKTDKQTGKNLLIAGGLSLIASVITPDLWRNWEAVFNNRSTFILNRTVETMRPDLIAPSVLPYTFLLIMAIVLCMLNWKSVRVGHILLLAGFAVMSLSMARNIPLFAVVSVPILSELAARTLSGPNTWTKVEERFAGFSLGSGRSVFWPVVVTLLAIISIAYSNIKNGRNIYQFNPETFPVQAVEFLERNPQEGNMFNEFNWGGYLLYRSWPEHLVFIDSQSDFYGEELMREYDQVMSASGDWQDVLNKYDVTWVIIPAGSPLAQEIINEPGWTIIYEDNTSGIGVRK